MRRIKLIVAYDGTNYCGWQVQPNGLSVQEVLNRALSDLFGVPVTTIGASRTDAGVHALGNVAVFDTEARMPAERVAFALNTRLPEDIRIQGSEEVPPEFHPKTIRLQEALTATAKQPTFIFPRCGRYLFQHKQKTAFTFSREYPRFAHTRWKKPPTSAFPSVIMTTTKANLSQTPSASPPVFSAPSPAQTSTSSALMHPTKKVFIQR